MFRAHDVLNLPHLLTAGPLARSCVTTKFRSRALDTGDVASPCAMRVMAPIGCKLVGVPQHGGCGQFCPAISALDGATAARGGLSNGRRLTGSTGSIRGKNGNGLRLRPSRFHPLASDKSPVSHGVASRSFSAF